jgi:hypothetical protein
MFETKLYRFKLICTCFRLSSVHFKTEQRMFNTTEGRLHQTVLAMSSSTNLYIKLSCAYFKLQ